MDVRNAQRSRIFSKNYSLLAPACRKQSICNVTCLGSPLWSVRLMHDPIPVNPEVYHPMCEGAQAQLYLKSRCLIHDSPRSNMAIKHELSDNESDTKPHSPIKKHSAGEMNPAQTSPKKWSDEDLKALCELRAHNVAWPYRTLILILIYSGKSWRGFRVVQR